MSRTIENKIMESFEWVTNDFKTADVGKNKIRIKGIALRGDAISRNYRKYTVEELKKAARTWNGKPLTINHNPNRIVGNVVWMEYNDLSNALEFIADINKQPYVDLIRSKSSVIKGVSIEAGYLYNICPECLKHGKEVRFETEEEFRNHMRTVHFKNVGLAEPHGIVGKALSLVLAPEEPGYPGTTIEPLAETRKKGLNALYETIVKEKQQLEKWKMARKKQPKTPGVTIQEQDSVAAPAPAPTLKDEHGCIKGKEKWDEQQGKCVPITSEQTETCPPGFKWDPDQQKCMPITSEAEYPWDQCIRDRLADGYTEEQAQKICAAIKNRTVGHTLSYGLANTAKEAIKYIAEKIKSDPLFAYNLEKAAKLYEQEGVPTEPPEAPQRDEHGCVIGQEVWDDAQQKCVPITTPTAEYFKPQLKTVELPELPKTPIKEKLSLGEPFAGYRDFADCVAQNQDKENPEAYCAKIKQQTEGEMVWRKQTMETFQAVLDTVKTLNYNVNTVAETLSKIPVYKQLPRDDLTWKQQIIKLKETIRQLPKPDLTKITEQVETLNKTVKEMQQNFEAKLKEYDSIKEAVAIADKNTIEINEKLQKLEEENAKLKQQLEEERQKNLKETQNIAIRVDNLEDKLQPNFKGRNQGVKPQKPLVRDPIKEGGK